MNTFRTLTGLTLQEVEKLLDQELPPEAYKPIPGSRGKDGNPLTDIDPNYATGVLNQAFGPCGLGWGYEYDPADVSLTIEERRRADGSLRRVCLAVVKKLVFWYKLFSNDDKEVICRIEAAGASDNDDEAYSLKGAITYALGAAISKIGWQKSVYLGQRTHLSVAASAEAAAAEAAAAKPAAPAKSVAPAPKPATAAKPAAPAPKPAPASGPSIVEEAGEVDRLLAYVIPAGNWQGKTLRDVLAAPNGRAAVEFWATKMLAGGDASKQEMKLMAQRWLELERSNHRQPQPLAA